MSGRRDKERKFEKFEKWVMRRFALAYLVREGKITSEERERIIEGTKMGTGGRVG